MSITGSSVADRLRAVMAAFDLPRFRDLADLCGDVSCSAVNQWLQSGNLPRVPQMIVPGEKTGLTLDRIYRGYAGSIDPSLAIRLNRRLRGS